jgi:hypothetical protein
MARSQESSLAIVGWQKCAGKTVLAKSAGKRWLAKAGWQTSERPESHTARKRPVKKAAWQELLAACVFVAGLGRLLNLGDSVLLHSAQLFQEFLSLTVGFGGLARLLSRIALAFDMRVLE